MSDKNSSKPQKGRDNIFNYAVIMIICVIIIILIAAMADNRENEIDNRIIETKRANEAIQNEIVSLREENYELKSERDKIKSELDAQTSYSTALSELTGIWNMINAGDLTGAANALIAADNSAYDENQQGYYNALCKLAGVDPLTKQMTTGQ